MKAKNKFILYLLLMMLFGLFPNSVAANEGNVGVGGSGKAGHCSQGYCWLDVEAIRITFHDASGNKVSNSLDFYNSNQQEGYKYSNGENLSVNYVSIKKSKIDYLNGSNLPKYDSGWGKTQLRNVISGGIGFLRDLFETEHSEKVIEEKIGISNLVQTKRILEIYEDDFFYGYSKDFSEIINGNYYMVVEPVTIIYDREYNFYYGTYYELQSIYNSDSNFGNAFSLFREDKNGNVFLAKSLYLTANSEIGGSGSIIELLNRIKTNSDYKDKANSYGIGIVWLKPEASTCNKDSVDWNGINCEPIQSECVVTEPIIDPCDPYSESPERIVYQYNNCPLDSSSVVNDDTGLGKGTLCQIQCNEKYYVTTWSLNRSINPIYGEGRLAGTYFAIDGPTVWHKKTCEYVTPNLTSFINVVDEQINLCYSHESCDVPSPSESCWTSEEMEHCADNWKTIRDDKINSCNTLLTKYDNMDSETDAANDSVGDGILKLFSIYDLEATKVGDTEFNLDGYSYGYKNMFIYQIKGNVNKYINMETIFNDDNTIATNTNYDNGRPMATTPINADPNKEYNYDVDFNSIFSSSFSNIISANSSYITRDSWSCPYVLKGRDTSIPKTYCFENCGDPDSSFQMVKLKMAYRPIDLSTPFPGKFFNSIQREAGANWNEEEIKMYITENREVNENEVYQKDAIYIIDLTPQNINSIRQYNQSHDYDDFELSCADGKGTECISSFLRNNDYVSLSGECSNVTVADRSNFYTCADK